MKNRLRTVIATLALTAAAATGTAVADTVLTPAGDTTWGAPASSGDTTWGTPPTNPTPDLGTGTVTPLGDTTWG